MCLPVSETTRIDDAQKQQPTGDIPLVTCELQARNDTLSIGSRTDANVPLRLVQTNPTDEDTEDIDTIQVEDQPPAANDNG